MKITIKSALLNVIATVLFFSSGIFYSHALTISPARLEISGDKGTTIDGDFLLVNEQEGQKTFYSSAENFEAQGETGTPFFSPSKEGLSSWINVAPQILLEKGQQKKIHFTIAIPKDADAGGHFAAIFLTTVPPNTQAGEVSVGAKVGMLILLKVNGEIKEGGGITSFDTKDKNTFFTTLPIHFVYRFNNSGNDRIDPMGEVTVRNTLGLVAKKLPANSSQGNILPNSTRRFDVVWGDSEDLPMSAGFFQKVDYQAKNFAFGLYTAHLKLNYGAVGSSEVSKTIFVLPWQLLIVVILLLTVILKIFSRGLKRYNKWIIKQAQISMKV